jgi:hypothetical protein
METFERMRLAILAEIAQGQLDAVRMFGRASVDWLSQTYGPLTAPGDPQSPTSNRHRSSPTSVRSTCIPYGLSRD